MSLHPQVQIICQLLRFKLWIEFYLWFMRNALMEVETVSLIDTS